MQMEYLALTALCADQTTLVNDIIQLTAKHQCNIQDTRIVSIGVEIAAVILIAGNWSSIAKLESALAAFVTKTATPLLLKRTEPNKFEENYFPYLVQIVALDNPGLLYDICNFFISQNINIHDIQANPFAATHTETAMTTLMMSISVSVDINISDLRERFMLLCEELNIDGIMEPEKR
jgi:glycine cleavage system transcriptional repressor